ncbi:MAG: Ger(x)C family spore germination protein [Peptococcaceae bacterium]|nr:Ger(x)C family spore germination protein [Peptococcaceae bacterium]
MTSARLKPIAVMLLLLPLSAMGLTGCWDSREIEDQFILTAIAIDVSDNPGEISVTAQVADITKGESGSGQAGKSGNASIVIKTTGDSLMTCLTEMDRDSSHKLLFHHNQIRVFGMEMARQGIKKHLDMIMRDQKARLEVPLAIVDQRGEEALTATLAEMPISGIYLGEVFENQAKISPQYRVRLLDFVQRLLDDAAAPVIPIIRVEGEGGKQEIKMAGMAVFHNDRMIGRLTNDEALGYILSFDKVKRCNIEVFEGTDRAGLHIASSECKREVTLRQDGGVRVSLMIDAAAELGQVYGFKKMKPPELLKHLEKLAQEEIKDKITGCFLTAQGLDADIFGFCTMVSKKYPGQWSGMKDRWDQVFSDIELSVQVKVKLSGTGQIVQSLEMEENMK